VSSGARRHPGQAIARALTREAELVRSMAEHEGQRLAHEGRRLAHEGQRLAHRDPFWPAQLTVVAAIVLYLALPEKLTVGPTWLLPGLEGLLVVGLIVAMPNPAMQYSPSRRHFALALISLVSAANLV
jgi:hypothetical protein